jgi:GNAT superfamily N-acetyltransferase
MSDPQYSLIRVETQEHWQAYHDIRRTVLFEDRGHFGKYDPNHPDDRAENNHPLLLLYKNEPIGAIRVDLLSGQTAIMRTVAIRKHHQRQGHGRTLLRLAEAFAQDHGCKSAVTISAGDAVPFYQACGYKVHDWDPSLQFEKSKQMRKMLA